MTLGVEFPIVRPLTSYYKIQFGSKRCTVVIGFVSLPAIPRWYLCMAFYPAENPVGGIQAALTGRNLDLWVSMSTYQTGCASGSYSLSNVVDDLKERLFTLDKGADSQKLVFVCHSMVGIVVRKLVVERVNDLLDHHMKVGLFLVASPSLGSDYAVWLRPIAKFAGHTQAQALRFSQDNQWLKDLDKTFLNIGDFWPETGKWDAEEISLEIANELLKYAE